MQYVFALTKKEIEFLQRGLDNKRKESDRCFNENCGYLFDFLSSLSDIMNGWKMEDVAFSLKDDSSKDKIESLLSLSYYCNESDIREDERKAWDDFNEKK